MQEKINESNLFDIATSMLQRAYVPYSNFPVGAVLLGQNGKTYTGCNVENASYGLTNCAERTAIFKAVSEGETKFSALLITGKTKEPIEPCGACRQVISEFCEPNMPVYLTNQTGKQITVSVKKLLPGAFDQGDMDNE